MFTKSEVEKMIKRIIKQDSLGDVAWEANKVASEYNLNISLSEPDDEELELY